MKGYRLTITTILCTAIITSGCVTVGNSRVSYKEACGAERPKCAPDGEFYNYFEPPPRPSIRRVATGDSYKEIWNDYLGRLYLSGNESDSEPCLTLTSNNISEDYIHSIDVNLVSESTLQAKIKQEIEGALADVNIKDKPAIVENISIDITSELKKNAYTKARYKIVNITRPTLDKVLAANNPATEAYKCKEKIKTSGMHFLRSIAVIGSEGKLATNHKAEINAVVNASLSGLKLEDGSEIQPGISANLALKISRKTARTVSTITEGHTGVYAYGYWGPSFTTTQYADSEFKNMFEISPLVSRQLSRQE